MNKGLLKFIICTGILGVFGSNIYSMERLKEGLNWLLPLYRLPNSLNFLMPELTIQNIDKYPQYRDQFMKYALANFVLDTNPDIALHLIKRFPYYSTNQFANQFAKQFAKGFSFYTNKNQDQRSREIYLEIFKGIMSSYYFNNAKEIAYAMVKNSHTIDKSFLKAYITLNEYLEYLADAIADNLSTTDPDFIRTIINSRKGYGIDKFIRTLIEAAKKNDTSVSLDILLILYAHSSDWLVESDRKKQLEDLIRKKLPQNTQEYASASLGALVFLYHDSKDNAKKTVLKEHICSRMKLLGRPKTLEEFISAPESYKAGFKLCYDYAENPSQTQTRPHFIKYANPIAQCLAGQPEDIKKLGLALYKKEREERKKGNYVFYHAQTWPLHFYADIYKQLWNIAYKDNIGDDFTFFRFTRPTQITNLRNDSLFMNHALFGNITRKGSCSFDYLLKNQSIHSASLTIAYLFQQVGLQQYYPVYATEINHLNTLHKQANPKYGNIMLISIPADKLYFVKPAHAGGSLRKIAIDNQETSDTKTILDALIRNPNTIKNADRIEYVMPLTTEYALDPHKGPRVYSFNIANPEKMNEYIKQRDELFARIKTDILRPAQDETEGGQAAGGQIRARL